MILKQFYLNCLAHASYLVGDEQSADRQSVRERLGERHELRANAELLEREEAARAAHPRLHLVERQQCAELLGLGSIVPKDLTLYRKNLMQRSSPGLMLSLRSDGPANPPRPEKSGAKGPLPRRPDHRLA